jgi:hypothetical protein
MNPVCHILILLKAAIVYPFYAACANIFVCHTFVYIEVTHLNYQHWSL